jgi:hypothetical protein
VFDDRYAKPSRATFSRGTGYVTEPVSLGLTVVLDEMKKTTPELPSVVNLSELTVEIRFFLQHRF